jgi:hypothetical protein
MYRVEIDARLCSGTSNCVEDAPLAFEMGDDAIARVILGATDADLLKGAVSCPLEAIRIFDAQTGKRIFP